MPAWRIFRLARTRRWAMVGSGTRKTAAISVVVRPHTERSVSGTRTPASSAGWQHVKMRLSWSSPIVPGGDGTPGSPSSRTAAASLSWRRDSRRIRSSALCRAVPTSHAPGFAGRPAVGHWARAAAHASWTASSASSTSPTRRDTVATACHQWVRKTGSRSTVRAGSRGASAVGSRPSRPSRRRESSTPTPPPRRGRCTREGSTPRPAP